MPLISSRSTIIRALLTQSTARITNERDGHTTRYEEGQPTSTHEEGATPAGRPLRVIYSAENRTRRSVLSPPRPRRFRPLRRSSSDGRTSPAERRRGCATRRTRLPGARFPGWRRSESSPASRPAPSSACQPRSRSCAPPYRSHGRKRHLGTEVRPNGNTGQTTDAKRIDRTRNNLTPNGVKDRSRSPSNPGIPCYRYLADRYVNFTRLGLD